MIPASKGASERRRIPFLILLLGLVLLSFIAILAYTYIEARRADPVILNEKGLPR